MYIKSKRLIEDIGDSNKIVYIIYGNIRTKGDLNFNSIKASRTYKAL